MQRTQKGGKSCCKIHWPMPTLYLACTSEHCCSRLPLLVVTPLSTRSHPRLALDRPGVLQLHCGVAAAVEMGSPCWPVSLVGPGVQRPGGVQALVYPGDLEVLYHAEYLPACLRAALDILCGVTGAAPASDDAVDAAPAGLLSWDEAIAAAELSDSEDSGPSAASSSGGSPPASPS